MSVLLAIVSALAPIILKFLQAYIAGDEEVHVVEHQEEIADAAVNAGDAADALRAGTF